MHQRSVARCSYASLSALLALAAALADAAGQAPALALKPGLWDVRLVKQVVDGRDISTQATASLAQAQQLLANLPPVQRARLEGMLNQAGVAEGSNGSFHICVSPAMAQHDLPFLDRQGHCQPVLLSRNSHAVSFRFRCTTNGTSVSGKGRSLLLSGDRVDTHTELTSRGPDGVAHALQNDTEMRYVSASCGTLKPPA